MGQRRLKIMADYDCWPLWDASEDSFGNVDPAGLPISRALREGLDAWAARFDATLDRQDPPQSGFPTAEAEADFRAEGERLLERLRAELGSGYEVTLQLP